MIDACIHVQRVLGAPWWMRAESFGYEAFGFDAKLLEEAVEYSTLNLLENYRSEGNIP